MEYKDLIIKDSEFENIGKEFLSFTTLLCSTCEQYNEILTKVCTDAVKSGRTHDGLVEFMDYITRLRTVVESLGNSFQTILNNYIYEIDAADDYLYESGWSNLIRDFTEEQYQFLLDCLDDPWCETTDSFGDWIWNKIVNVAEILPIDSIKEFLHSCHGVMMDLNNETESGLTLMFNTVHQIDTTYGQNISDGLGGYLITAYLQSVNYTLMSILEIIEEMSDVINPSNGNFNVASINARLGAAFSELESYAEDVVLVKYQAVLASTEEIMKWINSDLADDAFWNFKSSQIDYINENTGIMDGVELTVFEMFNIFKEVAVNEDADYNSLLQKKEIIEMMEEMTEYEEFSKTDEAQFLDDAKTWVGYIEKYGKDWYKKLNTARKADGSLVLDGRTKEAKLFKKYVDAFGNAEDILKYGTEGIEFIAKLLSDYSKGLEILDSLESNCTDPTILKNINEVQALYDKNFLAWTDEFVTEIRDIGYNLAVKEFAKANPVGAVVTAIDKGINIVGDLTGLGEDSENKYAAMSYYELADEADNSYKSAIEKLRNADETAEDYDKLVNDVQNCFEYEKKCLTKMYDAMSKSSSGDKASYYKYLSNKASEMSMSSNKEVEIMSYERFTALSH